MNDRFKCLPLPCPQTNADHGLRAAEWLAARGILPDGSKRYEQRVHNTTLDVAAMANCAAMGADPYQLRPVSHWARFSRERHMRKFNSEVVRQGFVIDDWSRLPGEPGLVVEFHDFGFTRQEDISPKTIALRDLAKRHTGAYEGWQVELDRHELDQGCQPLITGNHVCIGVALGHRRNRLKTLIA